jgi:hypothetical protein
LAVINRNSKNFKKTFLPLGEGRDRDIKSLTLTPITEENGTLEGFLNYALILATPLS